MLPGSLRSASPPKSSQKVAGSGLTYLGDLDTTDGDIDHVLAVGVPRAAPNAEGTVHILFVATDGTVLSGQTHVITASSIPGGLANDENFGSGLAALGNDQTHCVYALSHIAGLGWDQQTAAVGLPEFPQDTPDDASRPDA